MGFMGLDNLYQSDMAADAFHLILETIAIQMKKELKETANIYNTPGFINVALMFEHPMMQSLDEYERETFKDIAKEVKKIMEKIIKIPVKQEYQREYMKAFKRLHASVSSYNSTKKK